MEAQDLKTFILQQAGDFDKFDISATLKLSDEGLNTEIQKIRKKRKWFYIGRVLLGCLAIFLIINIEGRFIPYFNQPIDILYILIILLIGNDIDNDKKREFIYKLLLKIDKEKEQNIAA